MSRTFTVANPEEISKLLTMLLSKDVSVAPRTQSNRPPNGHAFTGVYVDQENTISALCQFDLALASYLGAALTMIPARVANEGIGNGLLLDNLAENLREVFNVCVGLFNKGNVPQIRFSEMRSTPEEPGAQATPLAGDEIAYLDLDVDIDGYGSGTMSLRAR